MMKLFPLCSKSANARLIRKLTTQFRDSITLHNYAFFLYSTALPWTWFSYVTIVKSVPGLNLIHVLTQIRRDSGAIYFLNLIIYVKNPIGNS